MMLLNIPLGFLFTSTSAKKKKPFVFNHVCPRRFPLSLLKDAKPFVPGISPRLVECFWVQKV